MECPNCHESIEEGAFFCGNCGQRLSIKPVDQTINSDTVIPEYSEPNIFEQTRRTEESMSLVFGVVGIVGALFVPLAGIIIGAVGTIMSSLTLRRGKDIVNIVGLVISVFAIFTGFGTWVHSSNLQKEAISKANKSISLTNATSAITKDNLSTPCYKINLTNKLNIQNTSGNCDMNAYNGATFVLSTEAYKVYATKSTYTREGFAGLVKQVIEKDVRTSLPDYTIVRQGPTIFSASPAYSVTATNGQGVSVIQTAVFHETTNGDNFFVIVHAVLGSEATLHDLQLGWQWK